MMHNVHLSQTQTDQRHFVVKAQTWVRVNTVLYWLPVKRDFFNGLRDLCVLNEKHGQDEYWWESIMHSPSTIQYYNSTSMRIELWVGEAGYTYNVQFGKQHTKDNNSSSLQLNGRHFRRHSYQTSTNSNVSFSSTVMPIRDHAVVDNRTSTNTLEMSG